MINNNLAGGGQRQSNYEALRLLCMLMVLNLHSFKGFLYGSGFWQAFDFFRESASICAVDSFILISGYFGIKWKFKSLFNLIFQMMFYSVGIYVVCVLFGIVSWSFHGFVIRFACLYRDSWGFAITYLLLYFCAPILNAFSEKTSSKELLFSIVVFFIVINFISVPRHAFFTYSLVYLIGRLLSKESKSSYKLKSNAGLSYWITTIIIFLLVYFVLFRYVGINQPAVVLHWPVGLLAYDYAAPLVILQAVSLFLIFSKLKFSSKFVNWCAVSCFSIYLIHMHPTIKEIGYRSFTENLYNYPVYQHILYLLALFVLVFFGSILVDQVRIIASKGCYAIVEKVELYIKRHLAKLIKS